MNSARHKWPPLQTPAEWDAFIRILKDENIRSYLEIGSMHGCSLWSVAMSLPRGSRAVAIDAMVDRPEAQPSLEACITELCQLGYEAHFIKGFSTEALTIAAASALGPYDALFIDGNHSPEFVLADWENYGPMARVVAFHDINWKNTWKSARNNTPPADGSTMGAPKIWDEVKRSYRHREFRYHPTDNYHGIGVLWRS